MVGMKRRRPTRVNPEPSEWEKIAAARDAIWSGTEEKPPDSVEFHPPKFGKLEFANPWDSLGESKAPGYTGDLMEDAAGAFEVVAAVRGSTPAAVRRFANGGLSSR